MVIWKRTALLLLLLLFAALAYAQPENVTLSLGDSSRGQDNLVISNVSAQAGNVTKLDIDQTRITRIWQGFYGNVTGEIVLENAAGQNFYDWTYTSMSGEIFATRNPVSDWTSANCTNQTTMQSEETSLSITANDNDGINETFTDATAHPAFSIGTSVNILANTCPAARPYNSTGAEEFYNVLLTTTGDNIVYTALIGDDSSAFEGGTADFEILVPVDKTQTTSTYYFYMELDI